MYMNVGCELGHYMKVGHDLDLEIYLKSSFKRVYIMGITYLMCLVIPNK